MSPFKEAGTALEDFLQGRSNTFGAEGIFSESLRIGEPKLYGQFMKFRENEDYNIPITAFLEGFRQKEAKIILDRLNDSSFTRAYFYAKELEKIFESSRSDKQRLFLTVNAHAIINHNSRTTSRRLLDDIFCRQKRVTIKGEPRFVADLEKHDFEELNKRFDFETVIPSTTACYGINERQAMRGVLMREYERRLKKVCGSEDASKVLELLGFFVNRRLFALKKTGVLHTISAEAEPHKATPMIYHVPAASMASAYSIFELSVNGVKSLRERIQCPDAECGSADARLAYKFGAMNLSKNRKSMSFYMTGIYKCKKCGKLSSSSDPEILEGVLFKEV